MKKFPQKSVGILRSISYIWTLYVLKNNCVHTADRAE